MSGFQNVPPQMGECNVDDISKTMSDLCSLHRRMDVDYLPMAKPVVQQNHLGIRVVLACLDYEGVVPSQSSLKNTMSVRWTGRLILKYVRSGNKKWTYMPLCLG